MTFFFWAQLTTEEDLVYVDISEILANIFMYRIVYTLVSSFKHCISAAF
jgi:hypothetical protein